MKRDSYSTERWNKVYKNNETCRRKKMYAFFAWKYIAGIQMFMLIFSLFVLFSSSRFLKRVTRCACTANAWMPNKTCIRWLRFVELFLCYCCSLPSLMSWHKQTPMQTRENWRSLVPLKQCDSKLNTLTFMHVQIFTNIILHAVPKLTHCCVIHIALDWWIYIVWELVGLENARILKELCDCINKREFRSSSMGFRLIVFIIINRNKCFFRVCKVLMCMTEQ